MKKLAILLLPLCLGGCLGYTGRDGEATGQAKKVTLVTNLLCPDYYAIDISLGVMRNGVGSMSNQDMWLTVRDVVDIQKMKAAAANGSIVRIKYDSVRMPVCVEAYESTGFEIVEDGR